MHPVEAQIHKADQAIMAEDLETLGNIYTEDAVLVVKPGLNAVGRTQIQKAFEAIATYFQHSLVVKQAGMTVLEAGDTALVLAKTIVSAANLPETERKATYVFKRTASGEWLCSIDNSYGHDLIDSHDA
ncbi:SgcJ/EcaC family oxidoreductase [Geothrix sp. SG200]|uniref:YybH family protein n=1 Tax=Geothrix sp. SG200 TaxID=2922865 RepID=UPI001FADC494|nr:SgcJ/EcaC family oxidoreductase [Geothrix sp. SG200]